MQIFTVDTMISLPENKITLKSFLLDTFYNGILFFTNLGLFLYLGRKNYPLKGLDNICTKSSIWVVSHDYVAMDSILLLYLTKSMGLKNVFVVVTPGFDKKIFVPGLNFIPRKRNTSNHIIKALEDGHIVVIFYTRDQIQYLNLDSIVKKCRQNVSLIPIIIDCPSFKSISHNVSIIRQLFICFRKKFILTVKPELDYEHIKTREKFIALVKENIFQEKEKTSESRSV